MLLLISLKPRELLFNMVSLKSEHPRPMKRLPDIIYLAVRHSTYNLSSLQKNPLLS